MIFVTVGTHEQQFNRLVQYIDELAEKNIFAEEYIQQIGYSDYKPAFCKYDNFYDFHKMLSLYATARIIITHGGPSSIIQAIGHNKIPIVVPRMHQYGEHVDDHQVSFASFLYERNRIILVKNIDELEECIRNYDKIRKKSASSDTTNYGGIDKRAVFCRNLEKELHSIFPSSGSNSL